MVSEFYVYTYVINDTNEVFYVGKGKGDRAYKGKRNKFCEDMKATHDWKVVIIKNNLVEEEAFILEAERIEYYRTKGFRLTNQTTGGDGISGYIMTEEVKEKISISSKERWKDNRFSEKQIWHRRHGVYQSVEFKMKLSQVTKGEKNGNYGNKWTEEMKINLSEKRKKNGKSKGINNGRATKIKCVETGVIYDYIKLACEDLGLKSQASLTIALNNPKRTAGGYHWVRYKD